jgi:hypothetical protein
LESFKLPHGFFAYFQLPDAFKDFAVAHTGKNGPSEAFMTHCHRELLHAQWKVLLNAHSSVNFLP